MEERWHIIGTGDNPIYICKKKEVAELFTPFFFECLKFWNYYHNKIKPPGIKEWTDLDPDILEPIMQMENHYKQHFSAEVIIVQYLESIIKHIRALGGMK